MSSLLKLLLLIVPILVGVAFVTLLERKILGLVGLRFGPNKVSCIGFLQPLGDAAKLANKQSNTLSNFSFLFYYCSSSLLLLGALIMWSGFPFGFCSLVSYKFIILFFFLILSLNSFCSILSGWSTFSKYSLIGSVRTVSQLISYEASLYLSLFSIVFVSFCFNFNSLMFDPFSTGFLFLLPFFFVWTPSFLAELNRTPYDFSEGESELVSGFNTEFGSVGFTLIFLSEYSNIILFSFFTSLLFFFDAEVLFFFFCFFFVIWIRSVLPRYRFDKLMALAWKFFIPFLTFCFICLVIGPGS